MLVIPPHAGTMARQRLITLKEAEASILGIVLGYYSLRTEQSKTALAGVVISGFGILMTIVYTLFLTFFHK